MSKISVEALKTSIFRRSESLTEFLLSHLTHHELEGKVLAITSKIVSVAENRFVPADSISKTDLVHREADRVLGVGGYGVELTIKDGLLIPSAGIDESNSENGDYILYPSDSYKSAQKIWTEIKEKRNLKTFGVILTDSHTLPLRLGVTGVGLSHWGFKATRSFVDQGDLFLRPLKFTNVDVLDALAGMAVYAMGEANEQTPLALIEGANVEFTTHSSASEIAIDPDKDLFQIFFKSSP